MKSLLTSCNPDNKCTLPFDERGIPAKSTRWFTQTTYVQFSEEEHVIRESRCLDTVVQLPADLQRVRHQWTRPKQHLDHLVHLLVRRFADEQRQTGCSLLGTLPGHRGSCVRLVRASTFNKQRAAICKGTWNWRIVELLLVLRPILFRSRPILVFSMLTLDSKHVGFFWQRTTVRGYVVCPTSCNISSGPTIKSARQHKNTAVPVEHAWWKKRATDAVGLHLKHDATPVCDQKIQLRTTREETATATGHLVFSGPHRQAFLYVWSMPTAPAWVADLLTFTSSLSISTLGSWEVRSSLV